MHIPYPLQSIPMVVFFKMEFWVGSSSFASISGLLNKKWGFYSENSQKRVEWGCIADMLDLILENVVVA